MSLSALEGVGVTTFGLSMLQADKIVSRGNNATIIEIRLFLWRGILFFRENLRAIKLMIVMFMMNDISLIIFL